LVSLGCREVTKAVLFPVRFMYTAETGAVVNNPIAVAWFLAHDEGPMATLVSAASAWRDAGMVGPEAQAINTLESGLSRLYATLATRYEEALRQLGENDLAQRMEEWRHRL